MRNFPHLLVVKDIIHFTNDDGNTKLTCCIEHRLRGNSLRWTKVESAEFPTADKDAEKSAREEVLSGVLTAITEEFTTSHE